MRDDDVFHADPLAVGRLAITGAVSNPRARIIDPRRFERRGLVAVIAGLIILIATACAWGLVFMLLWAAFIVAPFVWRLVEPLLTVLAVGVALVVIVLGIGHPG